MAREGVLEVHTRGAVELIDHARGQVTPARALGIFCRLNGVGGTAAAVLGDRVLAQLGARQEVDSADHELRVERKPVPIEDEWESPRTWLSRVRRRLGGRKNHELRRWIELHTGRTQAELLDVHVRGALRLIELLEAESDYAEPIELYTRGVGVPPSLTRAVYFLTLQRMSAGTGASRSAPPTPAVTPPDDSRPLRVVTR